MKILSVVGARPQFVKLAPIAWATAREGVAHVIVHTGQHYDRQLSGVFFEDLRIPAPDYDLGVGSATHAVQTAEMMRGLEPVLDKERPDWLLIFGDTNSTLAAALTGAKLHTRLAHVEAGLRSFNRRMPEELNRVLSDHASDLLLAPTQTAMSNLAREGLEERAVLVGDVMVDVLLHTRERVRIQSTNVIPRFGLVASDYYVATIHRAENTDSREELDRLLIALRAADRPVVLLAHPRLRAVAESFGLALEGGPVQVHDPIGYPELVELIGSSAGVITDSGGLQKEAVLLGIPCTTLRGETEWTETLADDWNVLAPGGSGLLEKVSRARPLQQPAVSYGDGTAAERILDALESHLKDSQSPAEPS